MIIFGDYCLVLAKLLVYTEEIRTITTNSSAFKLADLVKLYSDRLNQLCVPHSSEHCSTKFEQRLLFHFDDMRAQDQGRDIILVYDDDIGYVCLFV